VKVTVAFCGTRLPLPVTVMGQVPRTVLPCAVIAVVGLPLHGAGIGFVLKPTVGLESTPEAGRVTALPDPPQVVEAIVEVLSLYWPTRTNVDGAEIVKLPEAANGNVNNKALDSERTKIPWLFGFIRFRFHLPQKSRATLSCK